MEEIRRSQDQVLLQVGEENMTYALTAMTSILSKGGMIVSNTNTTTIGNAGVAITGGAVTGNVTGTAQNNTAIQQAALDGLAKLKQAIVNTEELSADQKEEAESAIEDLEGEARKPEEERNSGRLRNAFKILTQTISIAKGIEIVYTDVWPHLASLFHLAK